MAFSRGRFDKIIRLLLVAILFSLFQSISVIEAKADATCATGGPCVVGDTGPGGGKVFYVSASTFTATGTICNTQCKYLEAAPAGWITYFSSSDPDRCGIAGENLASIGSATADPSCAWSGNTSVAIGGLSNGIGAGYNNTLLMVANNATKAKAATTTRAYKGGSRTDWYLPSATELNELCKFARGITTGNTGTSCSSSGALNTSPASGFVTNDYWASNEGSSASQACASYINGGSAPGTPGTGGCGRGKIDGTAVRPIRAFTSTVVFATGTNPDACNQSVSNTSNITASRTGQECIVTFTNTTEVTWTTPSGVSTVSAIIVGGGGGGGDSAANATGGGGGTGGFFANSSIQVSGDIAIIVGAGGSGSTLTTQGSSGGTSYIGTLKVGGGGGGNGYNYVGGLRAVAGGGGSDFVSSGSGGGGRPSSGGAYTNELNGGLAGAYASGGVSFLGNTYTGIQGVNGSYQSDGSSGGFGGYITASSRTSTISGSSVIYSKISDYRPWGDASSTAGTKTPGSGGSPNYGYGSDPASSGGAGADGIVIIRYSIVSYVASPTYSGEITKGLLESITVTVNNVGKVRFFFDGKRIPGCVSISTSGTAPNLTATCTWKPSVTGNHTVYATIYPTDTNISSSNSGKVSMFVLRRSNTR